MNQYYDILESLSGNTYLHCLSKKEMSELLNISTEQIEEASYTGKVIAYKYIIKKCKKQEDKYIG